MKRLGLCKLPNSTDPLFEEWQRMQQIYAEGGPNANLGSTLGSSASFVLRR
jgi:hypothetical protein